MARDVPMMGTLIALACCASPPGVFLINWRTSVTSAVLFWMSGMCEPSRAASATCSRRFVPRSVPAAAAAAICAASTIMVSPSLASSSLTRALASSPSRRRFTPSLWPSSASCAPSRPRAAPSAAAALSAGGGRAAEANAIQVVKRLLTRHTFSHGVLPNLLFLC